MPLRDSHSQSEMRSNRKMRFGVSDEIDAARTDISSEAGVEKRGRSFCNGIFDGERQFKPPVCATFGKHFVVRVGHSK